MRPRPARGKEGENPDTKSYHQTQINPARFFISCPPATPLQSFFAIVHSKGQGLSYLRHSVSQPASRSSQPSIPAVLGSRSIDSYASNQPTIQAASPRVKIHQLFRIQSADRHHTGPPPSSQIPTASSSVLSVLPVPTSILFSRLAIEAPAHIVDGRVIKAVTSCPSLQVLVSPPCGTTRPGREPPAEPVRARRLFCKLVNLRNPSGPQCGKVSHPPHGRCRDPGAENTFQSMRLEAFDYLVLFVSHLGVVYR